MANSQVASNDILDNALDSVTSPNLDSIYDSVGKKYNLNPLWLKAQDQQEIGSAGGNMTAGDAQHIGHGQIGPALRRKYGISDMPSAPEAIDGMGHIMRDLIDKHDGDIHSALLEYTGGPNEKHWGPNTTSYPGVVEANLRGLGGNPAQVAYPGSQGDVLDDALKGFNPIQQPAVPPPPPANWNGVSETADAYLLGAGTKLSAATIAAREHFRSGMPFGEAYDQALAHVNSERAGYTQANPGTALTADLVGGLVPAAASIASGNEYAVAPLAKRVAQLGPMAAKAAGMLTGSLPEGAGAIASAASRVLPGAAAGATAALTQSGLSDKPLGEQLKTGAGVGALLGPASGLAADAISSHISPMIANQANKLLAAGIPLKAGQIPGVSPVVSWLSNKLTDTSGAEQRTALAQALSRTFGENTPELTKPTLEAAQTRIGNMFQKFEGATIQKGNLDEGIMNVLGDAHGDLGEGTGIPDDKLAALRDAAQLVRNGFSQDGTMSGKTYLQLTKRGSTLDRLALDPDVGHHAQLLRDELDNALEQSVAQAGGRWVPAGQQIRPRAPAGPAALPGAPANKLLTAGSSSDIRLPSQPDSSAVGPWTGSNNGGFSWDGPQTVRGAVGSAPAGAPPGMVYEIDPATQGALQLLRDARGQYKNLKLVSSLADPTTGEVQPAALARRVARFYPPSDKRALTPGEAQMLTLAAAKNFIPPGPTASKAGNKLLAAAHGAGAGVGAIVGEKALEHFGADPVHAAYLLGGGLAAGGGAKAAAAALNSTANARRIISNTLSNDPAATALTNQLLLPPTVQLYNKDNQQ